MPVTKHCPVVLTIAGSDSSAGAGIQADIKTCGAMGVFACTAVTAVTAQAPGLVSGIYPMPASLVLDQIEAAVSAFPVAVVKVGMLANLAIAEVVADFLQRSGLPAVIDPVFRASAGTDLCSDVNGQERIVAFYREYLAPLAQVLTPNLNEAALLLNCAVGDDHAAYEQQAKDLLLLGSSAVLLKGGHSQDDRLCTDYLANGSGVNGEVTVQPFSAARLKTQQGHGTGCTLASAIAAGLAQGLSVPQATAAAKNYLQNALMNAERLALVPANGPLHHFATFW